MQHDKGLVLVSRDSVLGFFDGENVYFQPYAFTEDREKCAHLEAFLARIDYKVMKFIW